VHNIGLTTFVTLYRCLPIIRNAPTLALKVVSDSPITALQVNDTTQHTEKFTVSANRTEIIRFVLRLRIIFSISALVAKLDMCDVMVQCERVSDFIDLGVGSRFGMLLIEL
jgi:hypothetical protein